MARLVRFVTILVLAIGVGVGVWWLAAPNAPYPSEHAVDGLTSEISVRWGDEDTAVIDAARSRDVLTALGYVHGMTRGWTAVLWRQTALGRLNSWFGQGVLGLDRHARRLAFARQAEKSYQTLPDSTQRRLRAYARGMNAALQSPRVQDGEPFVFFNVRPATWAPWHTLAVERLIAWLATGPMSVPEDAPATVQEFREQNQKLHNWLHLHDWDRSVAWGLRTPEAGDSAETALFHRFVSGASAERIVQEVVINRPEAPTLTAASLPGAPLFLTGTDGNQSWASLLNGDAQLRKQPLDSLAFSVRYERLDPPDGNEQLLRLRTLGPGLVLEIDSSSSRLPRRAPSDTALAQDSVGVPTDTAWVVRWKGLTPSTDISAWLSRAGITGSTTDRPTFDLFAADGLRLSADGSWSVLGTPSVVVRDTARRHIVVGESDWVRYHAQSLAWHQKRSASIDLREWSTRDSSTWAAHLHPSVPRILPTSAIRDSLVRTAASYLRNWTHTYEPSSVAATIFDQWMREYGKTIDRIPAPADTNAYFGTYRKRRALFRAVDTLAGRFGTDVREWRWERAVPDHRFFPVWSADSLVNKDLEDLHSTQYAPIRRMGTGHPSALSGGRSLVPISPRPPAPTAWNAWTGPDRSTLVVRRHHYDPTALFARSYVVRTPPSPIRVSPERMIHRTRLIPSPQ